MSTSSLAQASLNERKKTITTTTTTTCTRTLFSKLSTTTTSSTSSISSVMNEVMNDVMMTPSLQQTINPFEETNKFRLEQSVLSPNLFQIASTSTPERENNGSMWNIEQRAVLYPADIPTDESSLIAQYIYDTRTAKQVSAAVEAFWSQNKVIIESPLASSNGTQAFGSNQLKNRLGTLSSSGASSANRNNFSSPLNLDAKSNKKSHRYATSSVGSLSNLARNNSATKLYESTKLNKKDQKYFGAS
ncbi:aurora borealis-like [Brachionus plicatilis]|uniref:Protein aurora borealis n=1 Tax=Brachionus plicatilis TaxID=10195 RepID=A0A3M7RMQ1_BRAPC|nr:aurora borealis-like [Brachionus plicatilis]